MKKIWITLTLLAVALNFSAVKVWAETTDDKATVANAMQSVVNEAKTPGDEETALEQAAMNDDEKTDDEAMSTSNDASKTAKDATTIKAPAAPVSKTEEALSMPSENGVTVERDADKAMPADAGATARDRVS